MGENPNNFIFSTIFFLKNPAGQPTIMYIESRRESGTRTLVD